MNSMPLSSAFGFKPMFEGFDPKRFFRCSETEEVAFIEASKEAASSEKNLEGAALFGVDSVPRSWIKIISHLLAGQSVEFIAPTGAGKTTLYKLAGLNLPGSVLVVIPTLSLARTQIEELQRLGISAALWGHDTFSFKALPKFIYITPEAVQCGWGSNSFKLLQLHKDNFSLLVFDEISTVYTEQHFRPAVKDLYMLKMFFNGVPCFLCSAPVSGYALREIEKSLGFEDLLGLVRYKQGATTRRNAVLNFHQFESKKELREALLPFIACHRARSGIVFVRTIKEVNTLRKFLKAKFEAVHVYPYHSKISPAVYGFANTKENADSLKKLILERFALEGGILVCTSACAYGINCRTVGWVAFYGLPYSLNSFIQMAGRAGRDRGSLAFVWCGYTVRDEDAFRAKSAKEYRSEKRAFYRQQYELLLNVIHSANICRRIAIERAINPNAKTKPCGVCDVCRARQHPAKAIHKLLLQLRANLAREIHTPEALVFSQKTLKTLAIKRPQTKEELLAIKGIGPAKCEKYGERILEVINDSALF